MKAMYSYIWLFNIQNRKYVIIRLLKLSLGDKGSMDIVTEQKKLSHENFLKYLQEIEREPWFIAYKDLPNNSGLYSVLVNNDYVEETKKSSDWDVSIGGCLPGCEKDYSKGKEPVIKYYQYGNENYQPLVIYRQFYGIKPDYIEISEEFRLYHNLYYDKMSNKYIKIDDNGDEEDIIIIEEDNTVRIKLMAIKQFLAIKNMTLLFLFDIFIYSKLNIEQLQLKEIHDFKQEENLVYSHTLRLVNWGHGDDKSMSVVCGKRYIRGFDKEKCGIWPYNENDIEEYDDFIIGIDEEGNEQTYTSDPEQLANYFGKNPSAPSYLTPVFFKKEVLNKYYSEPDKYSVSDGYLACGNLWGLRLDNNLKDKVMVFLGDLGKDLSHKERLYWKSYNIPPDGTGISEVCWKRSFEAEPCDPKNPDLLFKCKFRNFCEDWSKKYEWTLFAPLSKDDSYHYQTLHLPSNNQAEFDEQVRSIVKILIDSINEKKIKELINNDSISGSISKFEEYLKQYGALGYEDYISFLRKLQTLRSSSVAHRKGQNYNDIAKKFEIDTKPLNEVFEDILNESCNLLEYLRQIFIE